MKSLFKKMNLAEGINDRREMEDYLLMAISNEITIIELKEPYEKNIEISYKALEYPQLTSAEDIIKEIKEKMEKEWGKEKSFCLCYLDDDMDKINHLAIINKIRFE